MSNTILDYITTASTTYGLPTTKCVNNDIHVEAVDNGYLVRINKTKWVFDSFLKLEAWLKENIDTPSKAKKFVDIHGKHELSDIKWPNIPFGGSPNIPVRESPNTQPYPTPFAPVTTTTPIPYTPMWTSCKTRELLDNIRKGPNKHV